MCVDSRFGGQILSLDRARTRAFVAASRVSFIFTPRGLNRTPAGPLLFIQALSVCPGELGCTRAGTFIPIQALPSLLWEVGLRSGRDTYSHTGAASLHREVGLRSGRDTFLCDTVALEDR